MMPLYLRMSSVLIIASFVSCDSGNQQAARIANRKTYDVGAATIQLPLDWKSIDFANLDSVPSTKYKRFLFLNTASQDSVRESLVVLDDERKGTKRVDKAADEMVKNLNVPKQMLLLASRDTLLRDGNLAVVEATCRNLELRLNLAVTCAFYRKDNKMICLMGMAVSHPGSVDQKNRALFRQMIESVDWK